MFISVSNKTRALIHSAVLLFITTSVSVVVVDFQDGEFPHTKLEWHHLLFTAVTAGATAVMALLKKSPLDTKTNTTEVKKEQ